MFDISPEIDLEVRMTLLSTLSKTERAILVRAANKKKFTKGQILHIAGDKADVLSIIFSGEIEFGRHDDEGNYVAASSLGPGESFGELPLFAGTPRTHDATALTDGVIGEIERSRIDRLMLENPGLLDGFLANLSRMLILVLNLLDDERRLPVRARIGNYLLRAATVLNHSSVVERSQIQIAEGLGVSRASVVTTIGELAKKEIVRQHYGRIFILDSAGLRRWVVGNSLT